LQVVCSRCNAKYKIGDDKLVGRDRIRLKCKKCDNIIEAKVKIGEEEDTSSLFSTSSTESITSSISSGSSGKEGSDIFEDNLFSGASPAAKKEFSFEDAQQTLVLDRNESTGDNGSAEPKFKSSFQMDFSDKTSQQNTYNEGGLPSGRNSAAISFETTQQISVDKFNEYQRNKEANKLLNNTAVKTDPELNNYNSLDAKTKDKFEDISKEFSSKHSSSGGGILKFIFIIIFIVSILFTFVLYKNNWNLNFNDFPKMIKVALGDVGNNRVVTKKVKEKPLKDQFFIDSKKIKTKLFKFSKRKKDKRYIFVVSGEIKNIDKSKKSLTTIRVKIDNILDKKTILEKRVYAGNVFSKKEIIKAKTQEAFDAEYLQSGKNGSNWGVLPNKTIPFMVVFYLDKKINLKEIKIKLDIESAQ